MKSLYIKLNSDLEVSKLKDKIENNNNNNKNGRCMRYK